MRKLFFWGYRTDSTSAVVSMSSYLGIRFRKKRISTGGLFRTSCPLRCCASAIAPAPAAPQCLYGPSKKIADKDKPPLDLLGNITVPGIQCNKFQIWLYKALCAESQWQKAALNLNAPKRRHLCQHSATSARQPPTVQN
eukprot:2885195-Rhodomonas_salina.1